MVMFDTKYPNNSRVVTGTPQLYNDDVILLCDTSGGAVTINLLEIPPGKWNTTWKLYVIDNSSNASVNNITIVAGGSQLINAQATLVLNTNDSGAMVRIVSDTAFLGNLLFTGGGSGLDELVKVTSLDTTEGFLQAKAVAGAGVFMNVLNPAGNEELEISSIAGTVVSLTGVAMQTLITSSSVVVGQLYLILDALFTQGGIYVRGLSTTTISREGRGIFLNCDYQNVNGDFVGVWQPTMAAPTAGVSMVAYLGDIYQSVTGAVGGEPITDLTNWLPLLRSAFASVYILEIDFAIYDEVANEITMRQDKRKNIIQGVGSVSKNTLDTNWFKWGDDKVIYNTAISGGTIRNVNWDFAEASGFSGNTCENYGSIDALNFYNRCKFNYVTDDGVIAIENYSTLQTEYNFVNGGSIQGSQAVGGEVKYNTIEQVSTILVSDLIGGNIHSNYLGAGGCTIDCTNFETGDIKFNRLMGDIASAAHGYFGASIDLKNGQMCDVKYNVIDSGTILLTNVLGTGAVRAKVHYNQVSGISIISGSAMGRASVQHNNLDNSSTIFVNTGAVGGVTKNSLLNSSVIEAGSIALEATIDSNVLEDESEIMATNFQSGQIKNNFLQYDSSILCDAGLDSAIIDANIIQNSSSIVATDLRGGEIRKNTLRNNSTINGDDVFAPGGLIEENFLENDGHINTPNTSGVISRNKVRNASTIRILNSTISLTIQANSLDNASQLDCDDALTDSIISENILDIVGVITAQKHDGIITRNSVIDSSTITADNNAGTINSNTLNNQCVITCPNAVSHSISENQLTNQSSITSASNSGTISDNVLDNLSKIQSDNNSGDIVSNQILDQSTLSSAINSRFIGAYGDANAGNVLVFSRLQIDNNSADVAGNYLTDKSTLRITTNTDSVFGNVFGQGSTLDIVTNNAKVGYNTLHVGQIAITTISSDLQYKTKYLGVSSWVKDISLNDASFFVGQKLTITNWDSYGIFNLTNCNGKTLAQIEGASITHDQTFINADSAPSTLTLSISGVAAAVLDITLLMRDTNIVGATIDGHTPNGDWIKVRKIFSTSNPVITETNEFAP